MTRKDGHFLPSLALALAAHALLLLLLSRALSHQVFEAPAAPLVIQVAAGPAAAGPGAPPSARPVTAARAVPAPGAPQPRPEVPPVPSVSSPQPPASPQAAPQPDEAPPAAPPADEGASMFAAAAVPAATAPGAPPAAAAAAAPAASGSTGGSAGVGTGGAGGSGIESTDSTGGTGVRTYKADIDPTLIQQVQVSYPAAARRLGQQGTVKVLVEVDTNGKVVSDEIYVSSGHRLLDSAALEAYKKAQFFPAQKGGRPVVARVVFSVIFQLTK